MSLSTTEHFSERDFAYKTQKIAKSFKIIIYN